MENAVSIRQLSKVFGRNQVLKNIDLKFQKGQFAVIFGPNGAGKTTLLKLIATLLEPTKGSIQINGMDAAEDSLKIRKELGMISHESFLYSELTAEENLRFFGQMYGLNGESLETRLAFLLKEVGLEARAGDRVSTFSRGMKQRLSIARAFIHEPSILLLDEPYTGLDPKAMTVFEEILKSPAFEKSSKIMISHDIERSFALCDRFLILRGGKIVYDVLKSDISGIEEFKGKYASLLA